MGLPWGQQLRFGQQWRQVWVLHIRWVRHGHRVGDFGIDDTAPVAIQIGASESVGARQAANLKAVHSSAQAFALRAIVRRTHNHAAAGNVAEFSIYRPLGIGSADGAYQSGRDHAAPHTALIQAQQPQFGFARFGRVAVAQATSAAAVWATVRCAHVQIATRRRLGRQGASAHGFHLLIVCACTLQ